MTTAPPSDLRTLADVLLAQAKSTSGIVLDGRVLASGPRADLRRAFGLDAAEDLTISGVHDTDIPQPVGTTLVITGGTAAVLGRTGVPITLLFIADGTGIEVTVGAAMGISWRLADSFAGLDGFPFDTLDLNDAHWVFATAAHPAYPWPGGSGATDTVALDPGWNFLANAGIGGISLVGTLLKSVIGTQKQFRCHGPFGPIEGQTLPVGKLRAELGKGSFGIGTAPNGLTLANPALAVTVLPTDDLNPVQDIDLAIEAVFNDVLTVAIGIPVSGAKLEVSATPLPSSPAIAGLVEALPGGRGFMDFLPDAVSSLFDEVRLDGFEMVIDETPSVTYLGFGIGTSRPWPVPGLETTLKLENLSLRVDIVEPAGDTMTSVAIDATCSLLHDIFHDDFEFRIDLAKRSKWEVQRISGAYFGSVSLGDIVTGLTPSTPVPAILDDVHFSDFGVTAIQSGQGAPFTYTIFGSAAFAMPVANSTFVASLSLVATKSLLGYNVELTGVMAVAERIFSITLDLGSTGAKLNALLQMADHPLQFDEIASAFDWEMPTLPEGLTLGLEVASFTYDFATKGLVLSATSQHYGRVVFASEMVNVAGTPTRTYLVDLDVPLDIKLSDIPVFGAQIPKALDLGLKEIEVGYASHPLEDTVVADINTVLRQNTAEPLRALDYPSGMIFYADLNLGDTSLPLALPRPASGAAAATGTAGPGDSAGVTYFQVGRQLGPLQFDRIGVGYDKGTLTFSLDAGFSLGPLVLAMQGLSVSSQLAAFTPTFGIDGLGIDLTAGPLEMSGAFLKVDEGGHPAFYGEISVKVATFGLTALGGYAPAVAAIGATPGHGASFFIFANLKVPLGGPPFAFITGFAGGFGIDRALVLPTFETLPSYMLLPANAPEVGASPRDTIVALLPKMQKTFPSADGEYWIAAGVSFTSFEMIEAYALLTVSFGVDLEIGLLGSCAMTFPKDDPEPVAYIEIDIVASFSPSSGRFGVIGVLTPASSLFGGLVHLSGGFAFYVWYAGPNEGHFVVSIGGYHPAFKPPPFYPPVPRLAMQFGLGRLQVLGQSYFALTPSLMMAGLSLQATWESGPLKAWFDAGIDFLIAWAPFHYNAEASMVLGFSLDLGLFTISHHLGVDLQIWGPAFGGQVNVDLDVVSFTIAFGARPAAPRPIGWDAFRKGFLPAAPHPAAASAPVRMGRAFRAAPLATAAAMPAAAMLAAAAPAKAAENLLIGAVETGLKAGKAPGFDWVVDSDDFAITARTAVPANKLIWGPHAKGEASLPNAIDQFQGQIDANRSPVCLTLAAASKVFDKDNNTIWNPDLGIRPMQVRAMASTLHVSISRHLTTDADDVFSEPVDDIAVQPILLDVATALYATTPYGADVNEPPHVPSALVGVRILPVHRVPSSVRKVPLDDLLFQSGYETGFAFSKAVPDARYAITLTAPRSGTLAIALTGPNAPSKPLPSQGYVLSALADPFVAAQRARSLASLAAAGFAIRTAAQVDVARFSSQTTLTDWPAISIAGAMPAPMPATGADA